MTPRVTRAGAVLAAERRWTLLIEAVAIVASILLAFSIDAWWDERADRSAERAAVDRLIAEYESNLALLAVEEDTHHKALAATAQLLAMTGPDPHLLADTAAIGTIMVACLTNPKFSPAQGPTDVLIASGELRLIGDTQLQAMLTQWHAASEGVREWQEIERHHGEELILGLPATTSPGPTSPSRWVRRRRRARSRATTVRCSRHGVSRAC